MSPDASAIRLEHVSKAFDALPVLRDVSFEVKPGQAFCILGRSGTGKSVTLKHIMGLLQPDAGRIFVENEEITRPRGRGPRPRAAADGIPVPECGPLRLDHGG